MKLTKTDKKINMTTKKNKKRRVYLRKIRGWRVIYRRAQGAHYAHFVNLYEGRVLIYTNLQDLNNSQSMIP